MSNFSSSVVSVLANISHKLLIFCWLLIGFHAIDECTVSRLQADSPGRDKQVMGTIKPPVFDDQAPSLCQQEEIYPSTKSMRLLVNKVCSYDLMISEHFAQVSDHPGLLDTSELLRPEAILKEKVATDWETI